jgi:hypothetical protein
MNNLRSIACLWLVVWFSACGTRAEPSSDAGTPAPRALEFRSPRVEATLEAASRLVRTRGFASERDPWRGFLLEQASDVRSVSMRTGNCYVIIGVGSTALRELELRMFDSDGAEVARDGEHGPIAAVRFCPAQNGTYFVASRASAGSGLYAARDFRGPTGLAFPLEDVLQAISPIPAAERDPG